MRRKILLITLIIALVFTSLISVVNASSVTVTMTTNSNTVPDGTELTVILKVSNIDAGQGINSIEGIISYDSAVFEALTTSSVDEMNDWSVKFTPATGQLVAYKSTFAKDEQDIAQITFKTKAGTSGKSGDIKFGEIKASDSESETSVSGVSTTITVGNVSQGGQSGNTANTNTNTKNPIPINNTVKPANNNVARTNTNIVNPNSTKPNAVVPPSTENTVEDIPYTGVSDNIMRAIFVVLVIAGISYFKYESIKER